ncbi:MAG: YqhA family protein [Chromatiales bacterium]|jgi:uncharacterized membrane protein YqhA
MKNLEALFEGMLWQSRLLVFLGVIGGLIASIVMFYVTMVDVWIMISHVVHYGSSALDGVERAMLRAETVKHVVEIVDGFLLATVLLIFSMGLYELFISKIDQAASSEQASRVLFIENLDDLKGRLAKVIMMILIVRFFEFAVEMKFANALDLLMLAAGIALLGLALYLSHLGDKQH